MRVRLGLDLGLSAGAGLVFLTSEYLVTPRLPLPPAPGQPQLGGLDQAALGQWRPSHGLASWATLGGATFAPFVFHAVEAARFDGARGRRYATDTILLVETLTLDLFLTEVIKFSVRRPRPLVHVDASSIADEDARDKLREDQNEYDAYKSFVSGHASIAFAMATAGGTLWSAKMLNKKRTPGRVAATVGVWAGGLGLASATAALRVTGGKHYPTDVLAGAALGTTVGALVPLAHLRHDAKGPTRVRWVLLPSHRGATLSGSF